MEEEIKYQKKIYYAKTSKQHTAHALEYPVTHLFGRFFLFLSRNWKYCKQNKI